MPSSDDEYRNQIQSELEARFSPDAKTLERVLDKIEQARTMDELSELHWNDFTKLADDIESFSRGHGLKTGWNTWIGIQRTDTSHLTIE